MPLVDDCQNDVTSQYWGRKKPWIEVFPRKTWLPRAKWFKFLRKHGSMGANGPKFSWPNMVSGGSLEKIMLTSWGKPYFRMEFWSQLSISHKITLYSNSPSFLLGELVSTYFSSLENLVKESGSKLHKDWCFL